MFRRFNIYYVGSGIMLFVMVLLFARTMRARGLSIWESNRPPAIVWADGLQGQYFLTPGQPGSPSQEVLAWVSIEGVDSLRERLNASRVLHFDLQPEGMSPLGEFSGLLAINDFEDRQILVEWYDLGYVLERQDGCELLFRGDTSAFLGSTLGELCFPIGTRGQYANLAVEGSRTDFRVEVEMIAEGTGQRIQKWTYRLMKEEYHGP